MPAMKPFRNMEPLSLKNRKRFLHGEEHAAHVEVESLIEVLFGDLFEHGQFTLAALAKRMSILPLSRLTVS